MSASSFPYVQSIVLLLTCCLLTASYSPAALSQEFGETISVGETGFAVKRPVLASACPHGCPWGEIGDFVKAAMQPLGYEVILCRNCNRSYGPGLVATASKPPPLDAQNIYLGSTTRVDAPVDFGITATDNLANAYRGTGRYADEGPYSNLRLIARIEDPRWLLVAIKADSGITDLAQIRERQLPVNMLANLDRPAIQKLMKYYGLSEELIEEWGGSIGRASILNTDADFDVIISNNGGPSNNPEAAYWTTFTQQHDLYFLSLPNDLLNELATDEFALERATAKWGLLRGVDRPIDTVIRNGHAIFARGDLSDEAAYDIARAVYQHREALSTYIRPYAYHSSKAGQSFGVPLHPGARRFYQEMGFLQPACVPELTRLDSSGDRHHPIRYRSIEGYTEEEYEFSCSALDTVYRTTFNLTRPADLQDFSGVLVVEPTHPSNIWPVRSNTAAYLADAGHASIAVNSHHFAVDRLVKPANPQRYQTLSVPDRARLEAEMLQQLGLAIQQGRLELPGLNKVILAGYSNTAGRVRNYIDYFQHRYGDVYDGYLVNQTAVGTLPGPIPDLRVPVVELQGERELIATLARNPRGLTYRRDDSPVYRLYEVAGLSHLDTSDPARYAFPPSRCGVSNPSTFAFTHTWNAVLSLLVDWVVTGTPAPSAPRIATRPDGGIIRDEHGNARGGMPNPQISAPVATMLTVTPGNPDISGARCDMIGPQIDFDAATLARLYGDHQGYMQTLELTLDRLIDAGWVLPLHRDEILAWGKQAAANVRAARDGTRPGGAASSATTGAAATVSAIRPGTLIEVDDGKLRGAASGGARHFLGIPYAAPPIGDLRWRPPAPVEPWADERDATAFGSPCPQVDWVQGPDSFEEDCLFLNVWTPDPAPTEPVPVMVWLPGGGNRAGSAADVSGLTFDTLIYDGTDLAATEDVVVVTINYRVGAFGFFAHPGLRAEGSPSGNQGLQDQQAALRWVRDNIRAFGGDPGNVTLFGESAGSQDTCLQVVSPGAQGLFHRAISQSGGCLTAKKTREDAEAESVAFAASVGCGDAADQLVCLRDTSVQDLLNAPGDFDPIVDREIVPDQPRALVDNGRFAKVPYLLGANFEEGTLFMLSATPVETDEAYRAALRRQFGDAAADVAAMYPPSAFPTPQDALIRVRTDSGMVCSTHETARRLAARGASTYLYNFSRTIPGLEALGPTHGVEMPYIFGTITSRAGPATPEDQALSDQMQGYWTRFARSGDPNGDGAPGWPALGGQTKPVMTFNVESAVEPDFRREECEFWATIYDTRFH